MSPALMSFNGASDLALAYFSWTVVTVTEPSSPVRNRFLAGFGIHERFADTVKSEGVAFFNAHLGAPADEEVGVVIHFDDPRLERHVLELRRVAKPRRQWPSNRLAHRRLLESRRAECNSGNVCAKLHAAGSGFAFHALGRQHFTRRGVNQSDDQTDVCFLMLVANPEPAEANPVLASRTRGLEFRDRALNENLCPDQFAGLGGLRLLHAAVLAKSSSLITSLMFWRSMTVNSPLCIRASVS